jgi:hypothetical protein
MTEQRSQPTVRRSEFYGMLMAVWVAIALLAANQLTEQSSWRTYVLLGWALGMSLWMSVLGRRALSRELNPDKGGAAGPAAAPDRPRE